MAVLNLPSNPTLNQTFVIGSKTYQWNGQAWIIATGPLSFNSGTGASLNLTTTTNATSINTGGSLTVAGGASIAGDLYLGGKLIGAGFSSGTGIGSIIGETATFTTVYITGGVDAVNTFTGDLQVTGGIGVGGNVFIGGILFSGGAPVLTTSSFNNTPQDGTDIDIIDVGGGYLEFNNISTLETVTLRGNSTPYPIIITNTATSTSTVTGALLIRGGVGIGGRITSESLGIADAVFDSTVKIVNSTSPTIIDQFSFNQFRSAKYLIQIDEGTLIGQKAQVTELLTLVSNTGTVIITEYGSIMTNGDLGDFDATVVNEGSDVVVKLYFLANNAVPKTVKVLRTGIAK